MIHSSAIVARNSIIEKGARIGANVRIGPFCHIQANVEIGEGTVVLSHAVINGHTRIGCDNLIDRYSSLGEINQDLKYAGEPTRLEIGDRNRIGQRATFHRGTVQGTGVTQIGNDNVFMNQVHIGHDCVVGSFVHLALGAALAGHVELDDFGQVDEHSAVHQFCILGYASQVLAHSCVVQDVPPFTRVQGNRCKALSVNEDALTSQFEDEHLRQVIRVLYYQLYHGGDALNEVKAALLLMQKEYPHLSCFERFFARSTRGIVR
ncbi:acyl-ACP--UDP-N-acetylglucosamine O-acyltransferase [Rouxiella badensis]|jgi:UDP-N-acetylglucosamine acyltransferase|uniref:Acyl-[acyl-carrier-protein]--UDP-N-acetylglucosamine O-acyltransferase n=1 Tax=Rouxiella badensis TaxID=1646377 RepID=A0A1X0WFY3_9GAMM|nr:acyl-ACP--UDP-N-acetylglucosamine O-acyltransferase [Rouxiella badensis]MCC3704430.1 acyl-ACP--UDP-N-acetylglucosamine O-acyltransferase [Rouxiella badensis]MCC3718533.1 acyl-ACP--UDP-N-acetylglucosamine O-acyltransferase [Rouxiella badensis]MCC3726699.1 acyl-ACP--UDP-N-acetylglucosamine O-acyltransferase [Rouxiella badensis]MCC3735343.1 acyl-ACP--UDP-N-acetylglucosamine O-acyltransferase [Rouxiella badensis]MCC3738951.1 acyl-ACP--UDP-N-acetylglucosamine O-acyltransferase [Rouxiella badensi